MHNTVFELLDELGVKYELHEHDPIFTIEEGKDLHKKFKGVDAKSLLLRDKKKKNFFLAVVKGDKRMDMKELAKRVNVDKLSFASPELLKEKLNITPGSVSPFALIYNPEKDVKVLFDSDVWEADYVSFHPNNNAMTMDIEQDEFRKYFDSLERDYEIINF